MKKTILAILMAMMTTTAFAEGKCEGGYVFEGVIDGHEYCISKATAMTWWAAFAWCQQQGRHLASLQEACEGWHGARGDAVCGNLIKSDVTAKNCWAANPYASDNTYVVIAGTGNVDLAYPGRSYAARRALCY